MINKEYWEKFYSNNRVTSKETLFARKILDYIKENDLKDNKLLDIACGNGRDASYFHENGIDTTGIDLSIDVESPNFKFFKANLLEFDYNFFDLLYLRFVVHSLTENELDDLLEKISGFEGKHIFIETRSTKGITDEEKSETFFKSSIGEKHFRMLYSHDYLYDKLSSKFSVINSSEGKFSKFGSDDPFCLRYILINK